MKRDDLVKLLGWRLGDRTDMIERIMLELDFVQAHVLEENEWLPWFLETEQSETLCVIGEPRVAFPQDFLAEVEESHLYLVMADGTVTRLQKGESDDLQAMYPASGQPTHYAVSGSYFQLFPTPDAEYPLRMRYYGRDALMTASNEENLWLHYAADVVIAAVGKEIAEKHIQDQAQAQTFAGDLAKAWERLYKRHTALYEVNRERALGG